MAGGELPQDKHALGYAIAFRDPPFESYRVPKARMLPTTWIPAISPYLRHGCMAGYPYLMTRHRLRKGWGQLSEVKENNPNGYKIRQLGQQGQRFR